MARERRAARHFREKVDAKLAGWGGDALNGNLLIVEEPWGQFTFGDELNRRQLAQVIGDYEIDVLIIGPVQTLGMLGGGTPAEVREFAALISETRALLTRPLCVILVHHTNKAGDVAGAWGPVPDSLLHVSAQGNGRTRAFWQKARWASDVHGTSWHLLWRDGEEFELEDRPEVTEDTITTELLAAVGENSGASWTRIREHVRGKTTLITKTRDRLLAAGELVNTAAREGQFRLWLADDPAAPVSETPGNPTSHTDESRSPAGTGRERPTFGPEDAGDGPNRSPVPYVSRNGVGNGTAPEPSDDDFERLEALGEELGLT